MNRFTKLSIAFATLAVASLLIACGGLLTMYGLNMPERTMLPQPITFFVYLFPVLAVFAMVTKALSQKYQ